MNKKSLSHNARPVVTLATDVMLMKTITYDFSRSMWLLLRGNGLKKENFSPILNYYTKLFKNNLTPDCGDADKIKFIKNLVQDNFNYFTHQSSDKPKLTLFSKRLMSRIQRSLRLMKCQKRNLLFWFSALQAKKSMVFSSASLIEEALNKHQLAMLYEPESLSTDALQRLSMVGTKAFKKLKYDHSNTEVPKSKSYLRAPTKTGGLKSFVRKEFCGSKTSNREDYLYVSINNCTNTETVSEEIKNVKRFDPFHISISGKPGLGKSHLSSTISTYFSSFFQNGGVYDRNVAMKHWDGYHNQSIVRMDDIGFDSSDTTVLSELYGLKSNLIYQLPMANLNEKGKVIYDSEILISTTNDPYPIPHQKSATFINREALWRRFDMKIHIESFSEDHKMVNFRILPTQPESGCKGNPVSYHGSSPFSREHYTQSPLQSKSVFDLLDQIQKNYEDYRNNQLIYLNLKDPWIQKCDGQYIIYPSIPPIEHEAEVVPIQEPLKVRVITKGQPEKWALKPLQKALWNCLSSKHFSLTHGKNMNDALKQMFEGCYEQFPDGFFVSGDYTAATDNLHGDCQNHLLTLLSENIDHDPTLRYLDWYKSQPTLTYPKPCCSPKALPLQLKQTNGQMMGELLSFPLLCLANESTVIDLSPYYLINGDDILWFCPDNDFYQIWIDRVSQLNLPLSVGKNYIAPFWGTINSQLIQRKTHGIDGNRFKKSRVIAPHFFKTKSYIQGPSLSPVTTTILNRGLFVDMNKKALSKDPRSLDIPSTHGGLGVEFNEKYVETSKDFDLYMFSQCSSKSRFVSNGTSYSKWWFKDESQKDFALDFITRSERITNRCRLDNLHKFWNSQDDDVTSIFKDQRVTRSYLASFHMFKKNNSHLIGLKGNKSLSSYPTVGEGIIQIIPSVFDQQVKLAIR